MAHHLAQFSRIHNYFVWHWRMCVQCWKTSTHSTTTYKAISKWHPSALYLAYKRLLGSEILLGLVSWPMCVHEPHPLGHVIK
jgi:hypothetical protein